jgi:hypothetical protein
MHKNAIKCKNKHGASNIIDMLETYQLPLQKSSFFPTMAPKKCFDGAWLTWELLLKSLATAPEKCLLAVQAAQLGTPRGRCDEHSGKFSSIMKPRFNQPVGERKHF